jgi:hypothetical protein
MDATIYCPTCRKSYELRDLMRKERMDYESLLENFKANVLIIAKYEASWAMAKRYINEERDKAIKLGDTGKHYLLTIVLNYMKKLEKEKLESDGEVVGKESQEDGLESLPSAPMISEGARLTKDKTPKPKNEFVTCRLKDGSLGCSHRKADKCDCDCHKPEKEE